ncbi:MAG: hypothetical protein COB23_00265 [Methylophaga sp.]|nr:MAG: hypothetical protein COB23_00265 [Methylophaga sp.]
MGDFIYRCLQHLSCLLKDDAVQFLKILNQDGVFKITQILTEGGKQLQSKVPHPFTALCVYYVVRSQYRIEQRNLDSHGQMISLKLLIK